MNIYLNISSHRHSRPARRCCAASRGLEMRSCCRTSLDKSHKGISSFPPPSRRHCPVLQCSSLSAGGAEGVSWNLEIFLT